MNVSQQATDRPSIQFHIDWEKYRFFKAFRLRTPFARIREIRQKQLDNCSVFTTLPN